MTMTPPHQVLWVEKMSLLTGFSQVTYFNQTKSYNHFVAGQITSLLTGSGLQGAGGIGGGATSNIQYGFESTCPGGINQNTALLATAAAIGNLNSC